ncbi:hypothetical protein P5V15_007352 [Pogonomyrmex californicus]
MCLKLPAFFFSPLPLFVPQLISDFGKISIDERKLARLQQTGIQIPDGLGNPTQDQPLLRISQSFSKRSRVLYAIERSKYGSTGEASSTTGEDFWCNAPVNSRESIVQQLAVETTVLADGEPPRFVLAFLQEGTRRPSRARTPHRPAQRQK